MGEVVSFDSYYKRNLDFSFEYKNGNSTVTLKIPGTSEYMIFDILYEKVKKEELFVVKIYHHADWAIIITRGNSGVKRINQLGKFKIHESSRVKLNPYIELDVMKLLIDASDLGLIYKTLS